METLVPGVLRFGLRDTPGKRAAREFLRSLSGGPIGPPKMTRTPKKWSEETRHGATTSAQMVVETSMGS